jgi:hypothetical protein
MPREIFFREFGSRYSSLCIWLTFFDLGLSISATKSEVVLFSRKRTEASPRLTMGGICLLALTEFKYLVVVFDQGLTGNAHTKCKTRINFMMSIAGTSWGSQSHPDNMLILFKGLVQLVLEYGCVCFAETAETHLKKLRLSLTLMQSTHTGKFEALSDVPPLDLRFLYLNQKFLVYSHARSGYMHCRVDLKPWLTETVAKM